MPYYKNVTWQIYCLMWVSHQSAGHWVLQCVVKLSSQSRQEGGHTSPTSQEQWAVFSWITVASSPLSSHWAAELHHSPRQETVTIMTNISNQSGASVLCESLSKSLSLINSVFWSFSRNNVPCMPTHTYADTPKVFWITKRILFMLSWLSNPNGNLLTLHHLRWQMTTACIYVLI